MGKNARHGTDVSRAAINEFLTAPRPVTLTKDELADDPVCEVSDGQPVDVWLRFPEQSVQERGAWWWRTRTARVRLRSLVATGRRTGCGCGPGR